MTVILRAAPLGLLSVLLLSGCQSTKEKAMCPSASVLANTSEITAFKKDMQGDPAGALYTVEITGVRATCAVDIEEGTTDSDIEVNFRASRAPSGESATYTVPYYLASMLDGMSVLDKHILATAFTFEPGQSVTTFTADVPSTVIRLQNGKKPYQYGFLVGIQMTREQLDYAKSHGRYAP